MEKSNKEIEEKKEVIEKPLIHDFTATQSLKSAFTPRVMGVFGLVIVVGLITGFLVSGKSSSSNSANGIDSLLSGSSASKGTIVGSNDTATFKDTAEGVLKEGGANGEGAYHLERVGGESQNVYLTSSIVDLSKYLNKKLKVWGQSQKPQAVGWLMDVGRIEVL